MEKKRNTYVNVNNNKKQKLKLIINNSMNTNENNLRNDEHKNTIFNDQNN